MTDYLTISKQNPTFPAYLDFQVLRQIGIDHLQTLSSQIWTDYNLHDPGVTILEVLCYAVTDLGYRTNLDTRTLLSVNPAAPDSQESNFFTPDEILTCNPVTELDWRKRLIDIPGVRNAWFRKVRTYQPAIYVDCENEKLQYKSQYKSLESKSLEQKNANLREQIIDETTREGDRQTAKQKQDKPLPINPKGLYRILLDLEPTRRKDACGQTYLTSEETLKQVKAVLCDYRNLCEDFHEILVLDEEEIALCTEIELDAVADPEDVLVEIYVRVQEFLAPRLRFYSLQELLSQGKSLADIFSGRPSALHDARTIYASHGFINVDELTDLELPRQIHTSDLYQILLDVPGVRAIKKLSIINYINGLPQSEGNPWCLQLTENHRPVLGVTQSKVTFYKGDLPFKADGDEVERRYYEQQTAYIKAPRDRFDLDLPVPGGSYVDLADHYSIHHDLPLTYGVGEDGLPDTATLLRKGQAKQLKGYLIFFDQILANYLSQLSHVRDLFSWKQTDDRPTQRTYFPQRLTNVPNVEDIILNYRSSPGSDLPTGEEESTVFIDYKAWLNAIQEDPITYRDRRNRFLDHLLARFAESFTDYVLLNYRIDGRRPDEATIMSSKARFLEEYPVLSRDRFRASNYCNCDPKKNPIWNTNNVSGFQQRVSRLMGTDIEPLTGKEKFWRRSLSHYRVTPEQDKQNPQDVFPISIQWSSTTSALKGKCTSSTLTAAQRALEAFLQTALNPAHYRRLSYRYYYHYSWNVVDGESNPLVSYDRSFFNQTDRNAALASLIKALKPILNPAEIAIQDLPPAVVGEMDEAELSPFIKIIPGDEDSYYFQLEIPLPTDDAPPDNLSTSGLFPITFTSIPRYVNRESTIVAAQLALIQIRDDSTYRKSWVRRDDAAEWDEGTSEIFTHHGYALIDAAGNLLAESDDRFPTAKERDAGLQEWLSRLQVNQNAVGVRSATECFLFEFRDQGDRLWLRGCQGVKTQKEAEEQIPPVLANGKNRSAYRLLDDVDFGFLLFQDNPLAKHPDRYATATERDLNLDRLLYLFNNPTPVCRIISQPDSQPDDPSDQSPDPSINPSRNQPSYSVDRSEAQFIYTLVDILSAADPSPSLLSSVATYPTADAAQIAFQQMLTLAAVPAHYRQLDELPALQSFSFALCNESGELLAQPIDAEGNLIAYATAAEREAAIAKIIAYVRQAGIQPLITNPTGSFFAEVWQEGGDRLWVARQTAEDEASGSTTDAQSNHIRILARQAQRYLRINTGTGSHSYGFALTNETGKIVADYPYLYETEADRDQRIQQLLADYGQGGICLWIGQTNFPNQAAAAAEVNRICQLARDPDRYQVNDNGVGSCPFSFSLTDELGNLIAIHPDTYKTAEKRDRQIEQFCKRFSGLAAFVETPGVSTSFTFRIPAEIYNLFLPDNPSDDPRSPQPQTNPILISPPDDEPFPTALAAKEAFIQRLPLILNNRNIRREYRNTEGTFAFKLLNPATQTTVATSSFYGYRSRSDMEAAIAFMQQIAGGFAITPATPGTCCGYYFYVEIPESDRQGNLRGDASEETPENTSDESDEKPSLKSLQYYPTAERAWQAAGEFAKHLRYRRRYNLPAIDAQGCSYPIGITDPQGTVLAAAVDQDLTDWDLDELFRQFNAVDSFLLTQNIPTEAGEPPGYRFRLVDRTEADLLLGTQLQPDEATAETHFYQAVLSILLEPGAIDRTGGDSGFPFGFQVMGLPADGEDCAEVVAVHPRTYFVEAQREAAIAHLLLLLKTARLITEPASSTPVALPPYQGKIINAAAQTLLQGVERFSTREQAWKQGDTLMELAQDQANFRLIDDEDGNCFYSWELTNEAKDQILAVPPQPFSSAKERQEAIAVLQSRINDEGFHVLEHILLRPKHPPIEPVCSFAPDDRLLAANPKNAVSFRSDLTLQRDRTGFSFTVQDEQGKTIFRSDLFPTRSQRDDAMRLMMLSNLPEAATGELSVDRYAVQQDTQGYSFVVAEGDRLIGQSRSFASLEELERQTQWLQANLHKFASQFGMDDDRLKRWQAEQEPRDNYDLTQDLKLEQPGFMFIFNKLRDRYYFHFNDCHGKPLFYSEAYGSKASRDKGARSVVRNSVIAERYVLKKIPERDHTVYFFTLRASNGQEIGRSRFFDELWKLEVCLDWFKQHVHLFAEALGVSLSVPNELIPVESIADKLLPIPKHCQRPAEPSFCQPASDPYSFWVSIILPYWTNRFRDMNFRRLVERTLRLEAPAHVALKICWVNGYQMHEFEEAYHHWLEQLALETCQGAACGLTPSLNRLITILSELDNVYPEGTLHDCEESTPDDNPIILNQTALGTANE
ncbi:hypothetical protein H6F89_34200 [Cyanobacteria bacterium FACHB-63]|nr:hypothetical protein [Cyanobacteria bacterium FACHB-63]